MHTNYETNATISVHLTRLYTFKQTDLRYYPDMAVIAQYYHRLGQNFFIR